MSGISVVPMEPQHVQDVVNVHQAQFPGFFLSFLGPRFLRLFYREILATPGQVSLVAVDGGRVIGFVTGMDHQSRFFGRLVRRRLVAFAWTSLAAALRRPSIIPRLFRALTYSRVTRAATAQALLMSIAVSGDAAGNGIGQRLVRQFLDEMRNKGIDSVSLTTDRDDNDRANAFYRALGFQLARAYTSPTGRAVNEYFMNLKG
jgi:ribosomal protein S18 acetylase RimI-like enzyme